jgi:hypothetical protein
MKKVTLLLVCAIIVSFLCCNPGSKSNAQTPMAVTLSLTEQKKLNTFFSNFAEASLESFTQSEGIKDEALISFALTHNYINCHNKFEPQGDYDVKIKKSYLEETVIKYFGKTISNHKSVEGATYNNGYYTIPQSDGEAYTFAQVEKFNDIGDSKFTADVNVYTAFSGWAGDPHAKPASWGKDEDVPTLSYKVKAIVSKNTNGKYILIEYIKAL